jgi:leucine dehydrogenase
MTSGALVAPSIPPIRGFDHEELVVRAGPRSGITIVIAVHSTRLGGAMGACRTWRYPTRAAAVQDALRLSESMTYKAAAAGVDAGGGKSVLCLAPGVELDAPRRRQLFLDFGEMVEGLDGRYFTGQDVGTTPADVAIVAQSTRYVQQAGIDTGPWAAKGVFHSMRACARHVFGDPSLASRRVAVVGLGAVGGNLAHLLADAGARLVLADIDDSRRVLAEQLAATWTTPTAALTAEVDIVAPCALGGMIDAAVVDALRSPIICGGANNQLADLHLAADLMERGVLYAPDFVANAGGFIYVAALRFASEVAEATVDAEKRTRQLEEQMGQLISLGSAEHMTPLEAARQLAGARIAAA